MKTKWYKSKYYWYPWLAFIAVFLLIYA